MPTLIPHGITPTGVGLRLRTNGALRPLSPCCGRKISQTHYTCYGCNFDYKAMSNDLKGSLCNDMPHPLYMTTTNTVQDWLRKITGIPNLMFEVSE